MERQSSPDPTSLQKVHSSKSTTNTRETTKRETHEIGTPRSGVELRRFPENMELLPVVSSPKLSDTTNQMQSFGNVKYRWKTGYGVEGRRGEWLNEFHGKRTPTFRPRLSVSSFYAIPRASLFLSIFLSPLRVTDEHGFVERGVIFSRGKKPPRTPSGW